MSRVAVIGHFGIGLNLANGQTIKTKIVTDAVEKKINEKAYIVDAHGGVKAIVPVVLGCIKALMNCDNIILMLTENGLKVSVPVLFLFNKLFHKKLHYVVIGGWLPKFLENQPRLRQKLEKFDKIYVETNTVRNVLENCGFSNVVVMPNFKKLTILSTNELEFHEEIPIKICTFSRVMKEKGIEELVNIVNLINLEYEKIRLDIYGQVDSLQTEWFEHLKQSFSTSIVYKGVIPYDKSVEVLKHYSALVFPTKFFTEGIPGTIIDGYAAGIPVVSSRWESFDDVVEDGRTGLGYNFDNTDQLKKILEMCIDNPRILSEMKKQCLEKAKNFTEEKVIEILASELS